MRLPQRKINLGRRGMSQIVGTAIGRNADDFDGRLRPSADPDLFSDCVIMGKITIHQSLIDDGYAEGVA